MRNVDKIEELISPIIDELGCEVARVTLSKHDMPVLQIMIEKKDREPIVVEDCVAVSRGIEELLDENLDYQYNLEVSSTGVDRPLTKLGHFRRFVGFEARVETLTGVDGRKKFRGLLVSTDEKGFEIEVDGENYKIAIDNVLKAKLILTDELLKAHQERNL